jgi:hypothetical protein
MTGILLLLIVFAVFGFILWMIIWSSGVGKPVVNLRTVLWTVSLTIYFTFNYWAPSSQRMIYHFEDENAPRNTQGVTMWSEPDPTDVDRGDELYLFLALLLVEVAMGYEAYYQLKET